MIETKAMKILKEKDPEKRRQMIEAMPEKEREKLLKLAEDLRKEGEKLRTGK